MAPILSEAGLMKWVGGVQMLLGAFQAAVGWRSRGKPGGTMGPIGALWMIVGATMLLNGQFADETILTGAAIAFIPVLVWATREYRARRARSGTQSGGASR